MDVLQHKKVPDGYQPSVHIAVRFLLGHIGVPRNASHPLERNINATTELAQSVLKRENPCILRVIDDMFYPQ